MKNRGIVLSAAVMLTLALAQPVKAAPRASAEQDTGRLVMTKLFRGVANLTTGWMEIPKQMIQTSNEKGFWKGISWGFAKGLGWAMGRTATGAYEIVTFPFPIPEDYHPVIHPEYVLSDLPESPEPR